MFRTNRVVTLRTTDEEELAIWKSGMPRDYAWVQPSPELVEWRAAIEEVKE